MEIGKEKSWVNHYIWGNLLVFKDISVAEGTFKRPLLYISPGIMGTLLQRDLKTIRQTLELLIFKVLIIVSSIWQSVQYQIPR